MTTSTDTAVACRFCGVATTEGITTEVVPDVLHHRPVFTAEVGVCVDCRTLRPAEPGSANRAALRLIGKPEDDAALAGPIFEEAGLDVLRLLYGPRREPQSRAWGHLDLHAVRADLRRAYVRVLDAKVAAASDLDRPVPPHAPDPEFPQACLACGRAKSPQWHGPITTGAFTKPGMVTGVVCDVCEPHLSDAGALGAPFLERAVMAHFGKEWSPAVRLPRLRAWIATGLAPQGQPWSWVEELREPEPESDLFDALRAIEALTARVAALEARLAGG